MRNLLFMLLLWVSGGALAAEGADTLEVARRLAGAGALQLALSHVEQSQPRDAAVSRWAEWEMLRLNLLFQLNRHADVLQRAGALPANMPAAPLREALTLATRAAVATAQGTLARHFAARVLWQLNPPAGEVKEIRLLVIESQVADRKDDDAFRSMLRFQQDHQPLDRGTATRFVEALLELGMAKEAVNWLGSLDDANPLKLLLRLRADLVSADAAVAQARAQLAKGDSIGYWQVLAQAATQQKNRALQIESLENILQLADTKHAQRLAAQAQDLWQLYLAAAQEIGNQNRLLMGDDLTWADFAARRLGTSPFESRALFAHLAQRGQTRETRHNAQLQIAFSLQTAKRELAALRLFQHAGLEVDAIDSQARYLLGAIAESRNLPAVALRFWQGLNTPPDIGAEEWQLRIAAAALRAGMMERAAAALKSVIGAAKALPAELAQRSVALAQEMLDAGKPDLANELFEALLPRVGAAQQRTALFGLGRIHESTGQWPVAADYYLRSALLADGRTPDTLALQARLFAALNLARAGYKDDARAQFEWLIRNSKDAAQIEIARRELKKLQPDHV
ncbi:MAG: hypothetical protein K2Y16_02855 [Burkholderiales bacterium]|nr:hypothetical protein [Burkholderiales bacterium]